MRAGARVAAVMALVVAAAAILLISNDEPPYEIKAEFQDASQLVKGDYVQVSGQKAGSVRKVELAPNGVAVVTLRIDPEFAPLRQGTQAGVRLRSLLGVANRYVALQLGPDGAPAMAPGERLPISRTQSSVDFDLILDTLTPQVRRKVKRFVSGSASQYEGRSAQANEGLMYLAPAFFSTDRVAEELVRDRERLRAFVVRGSDLSGDLASRRADLAGLIQHLSGVGTTLAARQRSLQNTLVELPGFMRQGDATFARLRTSLARLRPLVEESKPVVRRLGPFLTDLRVFATDFRPAVRDLSDAVNSPGRANDLRDLLVGAPALRDAAVRPVRANGKRRPATLPITASALSQATPELAFARPYAIDLSGWFNDFGASGVYDALGGESRSSATVGAFQNVAGTLIPIPPELRGEAFQRTAQIGFTRRCPGADERNPGDGSTPYVTPGFDCNPKQVPPGK